MPKSLDAESSDGFPSEGEPSPLESVKIGDFRVYLSQINIRISPRDQGVLYRYFQQEFFKNQSLSGSEVYPMLKKFLTRTAGKRNIEVIRKDCMRTANLWTLDKLCGIEIEGDELPMESAVRQELDRLQRCAARLPTNVNEKDTRKRDWMFQRYDIGKTGRLVMAAVDNMIHILFGEIAYDVKDVVRAAFRATKNVSLDSGAADPHTYNQIEREEFRLLMLALKSHIELFIAFRMVDSSRDMKIDFDEFKKSLPLLKKWGVDTSDPHALFEIIDADHSGEITFTEFVNWSLKEAIIADLEFRERLSHHVELGDTVLLTGDLRGVVAKVISYDRSTKTYVLELPDGTRINKKNTEFVNGAATEEVLPPTPTGVNAHSKWFERLLKDIMPGTDHPWITETPIYIKSEWSNRKGEYSFEIRCKFGRDSLKSASWGKSFKEAKNFASKGMRSKIETHPKVLEALQYVNNEVAKEKETENRRMAELKQDQSDDQAEQQAYRMQLWKRDIIGVPQVDGESFFKIMKDCSAKVNDRDSRLIHRHCAKSTKNNASAYFADLDDFFQNDSNAKRLDRKLQSIRDKVMKSWRKKKWIGFVRRSNPDNAEENMKEWDDQHEAPSLKGAADGLEYKEFHDGAENPDAKEEEVEALNEKIMHEQEDLLAHLEGFVDSDEEKGEEVEEAAPAPKVKSKSGKKGGLLVIKSTSKKTSTASAKDEKKKTNIVRRRPPSGKQRA